MDLVGAATRGNHVAVTALLAQGVDVNSKDMDGRTALSRAAEVHDVTTMKLLLNHPGVDLNSTDNEGNTPLWWATESCNIEAAHLLLRQEGIDENQRGYGDGHSSKPPWAMALMRATTSKAWLPMAKLLLSSDGVQLSYDEVNPQDVFLQTVENGIEELCQILLDKRGVSLNADSALHLAITNKHSSIVQLLLSQPGINVNAKDQNGQPALVLATAPGRKSIIELLLTHKDIDVNLGDEQGRTPLSWAATRRSKKNEICGLLLQRNDVQLSLADHDGRTPLSWAAGDGGMKTVELLVAKIAPSHVSSEQSEPSHANTSPLINASDSNSSLPSYYDSSSSESSTARIHKINNVLTNKVESSKLDQADKSGRTPLSWAAGNGRGRVMKFLLAKTRVDLASADAGGRTPFSWAAGNGQEKVVKQLLQHRGIKRKHRDAVGRTPLSWAAGNGHETVVKLLLSQILDPDANGRTPFSWAAGNGHAEVVNVLVAMNSTSVVVDSRDSHGRTPLSWAAGHGHGAVVAKLLPQTGVDINAIDHDGMSPLFHAVKHGHIAVVQQVLNNARINPNATDMLGQTALHYAATSNKTDIVNKLLTHRDILVNARDTSGITPLQKAVHHKATESIQSLLRSSASTEGIMRDDWVAAFDESASHIVVLSEVASNGTNISFITEEALPAILSTSAQTRHLFLCGSFSPWDKQLIPNSLRGCDGVVEWRTERMSGSNTVTSFMTQIPRINQSQEYLGLEWCRCVIAWDKAPHSNGAVSLNYFSMLPDSTLPKNAATLFEQLLCHVRQMWLQVCDECELYLADQRRYQLQEKGESLHFVHDLARDAKVWSSLRYHLRDHVHYMNEFTKGYLRFSGINYNEGKLLVDISEFEATIHERMNSLDQTLRDLLQFEFAWVSINEARRSIDLATSMKRLTWITFIFLPLMFSSSLFGMNVDLLKDNPKWPWYVLFAAVSLVLTACGWLIFRLNPLKRILKRLNSSKLPEAESQTTLPK